MAKKKAASKPPAGQLGDWLDDVPDEVLALAEVYDKAHTAKSKASAKLNTAKDNLIAGMEEHECPRCPIRNGSKHLVLDESKSIKYKKPQSRDDDDDE